MAVPIASDQQFINGAKITGLPIATAAGQPLIFEQLPSNVAAPFAEAAYFGYGTTQSTTFNVGDLVPLTASAFLANQRGYTLPQTINAGRLVAVAAGLVSISASIFFIGGADSRYKLEQRNSAGVLLNTWINFLASSAVARASVTLERILVAENDTFALIATNSSSIWVDVGNTELRLTYQPSAVASSAAQSVTINLPSPVPAAEIVIARIGTTTANNLQCWLGDTGENDIELLENVNISGRCEVDQLRFLLSFRDLESGDIKIFYRVN